ncbi:MAG: hypothetical protein ABI689_14145 [Thermoanaerobaculia bacterium]
MKATGAVRAAPGVGLHGRCKLDRRRARHGDGLAALGVAFALALAPPLGAEKQALEIPYYLAVDLSQLEISVTTTALGEVEKQASLVPGAPVTWKFSRSVAVEREGSVSLKTVADAAAQQSLRVPKATWSDVDATVNLTDSGLLVGINASAEGRGDDFLLAVAKFAGVAVGFATGGAIPVLAAEAFAAGSPHAQGLPHALQTLTPAPAVDCPDLEGVPVEMEAFVRLDPVGCPAFTKLREATANVEAKRVRRDLLAEQVPGTFGAELTEVTRKLQSYRQEVAYAEAVEAQRRATLTTLFERFARARCLGLKVKSAPFREFLALDRIPSAAGLKWLDPGMELPRAAVEASLESSGWTEMLDLFRRTGVVATLDGAPTPPPVASTVPCKKHEQKRVARAELPPAEPISAIAWRQPVPVRLRIWMLMGDAGSTTTTGDDATACEPESGDDPDKGAVAKVSFDDVIDVLHPNSPVRTLPLDARAFSDRSLSVAFDPRGRPRKIDTSGTSSAAGFAQAAAASAQGFRDEYDATLKKRVSIEESKRELALDGWKDKIAALEAQKKELDARAELLGASGSFDDLVARQKLDSELKLLEAQVSLRMAEATAEQRVAIAELEKRVLETQKRLALLEAEQALEEAHRKH